MLPQIWQSKTNDPIHIVDLVSVLFRATRYRPVATCIVTIISNWSPCIHRAPHRILMNKICNPPLSNDTDEWWPSFHHCDKRSTDSICVAAFPFEMAFQTLEVRRHCDGSTYEFQCQLYVPYLPAKIEWVF